MIMDGRAEILRELMEGESEYTQNDSELTFDVKGHSRVWRMALEHVRFVSRFGVGISKAEQNGKFYSTYPKEFEQWLDIGAPGLCPADIDAYLAHCGDT